MNSKNQTVLALLLAAELTHDVLESLMPTKIDSPEAATRAIDLWRALGKNLERKAQEGV